MKARILFLVGFFFATTFALHAQPPGGGRGMMRTPEERVKTLFEKAGPELKLEKETQAKVEAAYLDFYKGQQKIFEAARNGGERPDRSVFEKMTTERDEKVKKLITEEQFKKLKEIEEAQRPQRGGGGNGGGNRGGQQ